MGGQCNSTFGLPQLEQAANNLAIECLRYISSDIEEMTAFIADKEHKLITDQLGAYNTIISSTENERGSIFFLDGPDETIPVMSESMLLLCRCHPVAARERDTDRYRGVRDPEIRHDSHGFTTSGATEP
ncbi:Hypothetical predicted protein [Octopus vulgaris]|uniref:Uncharacterized protein n=1 Tax=Octopus vulgaris TaxID=6645 RepID=A0AA36BWE3_OCTVU|nr:Hypothetical predicted protein [Octopus vulgaris]